MTSFRWAKVGLLLADGDRYAAYYREALEHAGLRYELLTKDSLFDLSSFHVILLCGRGDLGKGSWGSLKAWLEAGGSLIASGSTFGDCSPFGLAAGGSHSSNAVLKPIHASRLWPDGAEDARFFGGTTYLAKGCKIIAKVGEKVAMSRHRQGTGSAYYFAPHLGQTATLMQLGRSVETDAIGPDDGSACLDDDVLRCEDGTNLDFREDRQRIEGSAPFFATPHVDVLAETWIRMVIEAIELTGRNCTLLWQWPHAADATAMITLDCEDFEPEKVQKMHRLLSMYGCRAGWMVSLPGYTLDVYRALRNWDHEIGFLFTTDNDTGWHEERLKIQMVSLSRNATANNMIAARPADGKWKGYTSFYELAENAGARLSLSKGGRQPGTQGFLFGTCHPFFPLKRDGSPFLIGEMPYSIYMPGEVASDEVWNAIIETCHARSGCFHVALRPEALQEPHIFNSFQKLLTACRQHRLRFIKPEEMHRFERGRRALRIRTGAAEDGAHLQISADTNLEGLTLMVLGEEFEADYRGKPAKVQKFSRYGTTFHGVTIDLLPKLQGDLVLKPSTDSLAA